MAFPAATRYFHGLNFSRILAVNLFCFVGCGQIEGAPGPVSAAANTRPAIKDLNTPRDFPSISSRKTWEERAVQIREQAMVSCGLWPMPEKTPIKAQIFGKIERDGYSIEKVYFQTYPGFYLAGNLYRPLGQGKGPFPAILNPHGHWKEGRMADTKDGSIPARCISFARQGMIAFSYDMVGFNDTHFPDSPTNKASYDIHRSFGAANTDQLWSISLMGLQTWNSIRALDFLESLPDADKKRLACTGESGGGTQTYMLGAVDDRLAAQAPIVMVSHIMQGGCSCENAPGLRVEYSNMEIAAAAAPRPQMLVAASGDWTKDTLTVEGPSIAHIYDLLHARDKFHYVRFDFGHNYNQTSREAVYGWFGQWLRKRPDATPLPEAPYQKEPDSELRVFPDGKLPPDALTQEKFVESLKQMHREAWRTVVPHDKESLAHFNKWMLPAWRRTLQLEWPVNVSGTDLTRRAHDASIPPGSTIVILARGAGNDPQAESLISKLEILRISGISVDAVTNPAADPFKNFFTTYNRTVLQETARNLVNACATARAVYKPRRIVLCGLGRLGLSTLMAAPAADAVIADCAGLDTSDDNAFLEPDIFCPGIRTIGGFEGPAMLAAPHNLLLHNTGTNFSEANLRAAYQAAGAVAKFQTTRTVLTPEAIGRWVFALK
jgi:hypothetical protein